MKLSSMILAASLALMSGAVFASSCPKHMKAIDAALPKAKLSTAQMAEVKKLRTDGETFHKNKKHAESMEALGKAEKMLGI
jgi:hypothetical protein